MNGLVAMDSQSEFLREALSDSQSTIRAIDAKLAAFLTALILPFSLLGRAWAHIKATYLIDPHIGTSLFVLFFLLWFLSITCIVTGLAAIGNPAEHIKGGEFRKTCFYAGGLFKFRVTDAFFNKRTIKSNISLEQYIALLPSSEADIKKELAFENLKLSYIRDIKLHRLKVGFRFSACWIITGTFIFLLSKLSTN
jgi:hypothetical protein